ncbi:hypothetical protein L532_2313 [Bordetella bronchiseptica OSU095]|uniref:hypothetical protein n=1 Tax=Bordetella bronchiseptica TaxID=518 RepID=UPI00049FC937|nr:hypothetical protein [Bordetella bronchiseptica]KDD44817.1 hypothetical protein L532_2313 [Bordetella bronchiseptica OSU095]
MTHVDLIAGQPAGVPLDPLAGTLADSHARVPTFDLEKINTDVADPWARPELANLRNSSSPAPGETSALNVNILALDLGTKLGWAVRGRDGRISHGTEVFTPRASWSPGQRWLRARSFLVEVITQRQVHAIAYEDVKRHTGTDAAHAYGAFLCIVEMLAGSHRLRLLPVGVSTIKKHWTGKGNADKAAMLTQAKARGFRPETDNDADALAILSWAVAQERAA